MSVKYRRAGKTIEAYNIHELHIWCELDEPVPGLPTIEIDPDPFTPKMCLVSFGPPNPLMSMLGYQTRMVMVQREF